ncbi:MAG: SHOCT domain-containing protein [Candidatus Gracilibacteria bacterium]|nr:SHOCT domain-containing protein [Candidatus Gracilibacteria bacterium]
MKTSLYYKVYFLTFLTMMYGYYGYDGYMPFGEHFTFLGPILMVLFWVFIIVLVVYLVRGDTGFSHKHVGHAGKTALDILKERYAKGEIDKKEFEAIKKDLM